MNQFTLISTLLLLTAADGAHACSRASEPGCVATMLVAAADDELSMRYRESDEGDTQGPLTVHVTTFDSSPATPGMWYERPRETMEDEALQQRPLIPRAPFDRPR